MRSIQTITSFNRSSVLSLNCFRVMPATEGMAVRRFYRGDKDDTIICTWSNRKVWQSRYKYGDQIIECHHLSEHTFVAVSKNTIRLTLNYRRSSRLLPFLGQESERILLIYRILGESAHFQSWINNNNNELYKITLQLIRHIYRKHILLYNYYKKTPLNGTCVPWRI